MADTMLRTSISRGTPPVSRTSTTLKRSPRNNSTSTSATTNVPPWTSASTTSRTRERLRLIEHERDELRNAVAAEQAVNDRLKRERDVPELSNSEAKSRVLKLQGELRTARAQSPRLATAGLFKKACSTDLLFLIDTTSSMWNHIEAAKEQVRSIVKAIENTFYNEADVRIAVVGYKDHTDSPHIQFLDFTPSTDQVRSFLDKLEATGGGDTPEDVLGGIKQALDATWSQQTRCIIHIADAPPHGRTNHDLHGVCDDRYPEAGTEPHGFTYEPLLQQMVDLKINYALLRITEYTDRMALNFSKVYAAALADCKLLPSNKYYGEAMSRPMDSRGHSRHRGMSKNSATGGLIFEESNLGTAYDQLQHLVHKVVTTSASRTASRISRATTLKSRPGETNSGLVSILEDEEDSNEVQLEDIKPKWNTPGWFNETLLVEGFSPDVGLHGASTLDNMMAHDDNIKMRITELTLHKRSRPFAQGAMRTASYARTNSSTNHFVVKSFKKSGKRLAHVAEDMQIQALCKAFALEFNSISGEEHPIDFIVTTCLKGRDTAASTSSDDCMSLEPFIEGSYVKYNSNSGYVNRDSPDDRFNEAAQAFSHFTFERSRGQFLVSDLQGCGYILTDPAVHTRDPERFRLADTNLGKEGFKFFFATHECNSICRSLGLKSNRSMVASDHYEFRETWSSMGNTICCSNKLCGKMLRLASAKNSIKFPGYNWCDRCFPQLETTMVHRICIAPGPHHEFKVSEFFSESQGRRSPRKCDEHRDEDVSASRTATVSGSLWTRLRGATKKNSVAGGRLLRRSTSTFSMA